MRLIDADELLKHKTDHEMISTHLIYNMPTIEAEPVRRGRWKYVGVNTYDGVTVYEPTYRCSACGCIFESYVRLDMPVMPKDASFPRYCLNCGATMEGQE